MTKLVVFKNGEHFAGFECLGHSGYAQQGEDIVCAAVSTAVQFCAGYLVKYFGEKVSLTVDNENTCITLLCNQNFTEADRQISVLVDFERSASSTTKSYFSPSSASALP